MKKKITHDLFKRFNHKLFFAIFSFLLLVASFTANAATQISGTVTDEHNQPLPGVTVRIKNTTQAVSTDLNGKYTISADQGTILTYSFIGYVTREITVGSTALIDVKLAPQANMLQEVVAIGYQTIRKSDLTGSISSVKASDLNLSAPTLGQALVGKVAGVQVSQTRWCALCQHQNKGERSRFLQRQFRSVYVIDGYPAGNDIFINP
jgi:hypothetical protein